MTYEAFIDAVREMCKMGYAVILWTPEELVDIAPDRMEELCIQAGNEARANAEDF